MTRILDLDTAKAVWARMKADNVTLLAAAVAFWGMLALVPALAALVSLYGLVADPTTVERQVVETTEALPEEAQRLIVSQLRGIVDSPSGSLGAGLLVSIAVALVAASAGLRTLLNAVGVVYGDRAGDEGAVKERGKALALTLGAIAFVATAVWFLAVVPTGPVVVGVLKWGLFGAGLVAGIGVLYRLGPARRPEPRLLSPGAVVAAALAVLATVGFSLYTSSFGTYNETYGSLGAVVVLLLWLQLTALTVLAGAELNQVLAGRTPR